MFITIFSEFLFGCEEKKIIGPALEMAPKELKKNISGPFSADTVFWQALNGEYDGVLAMYQDQGLAPLKTIHFDEAVNTPKISLFFIIGDKLIIKISEKIKKIFFEPFFINLIDKKTNKSKIG